MAREQWVMVGVISMRTVTMVLGEGTTPGIGAGVMWMSGRLMTESWPRETGCSGSEMVEMRSEDQQY